MQPNDNTENASAPVDGEEAWRAGAAPEDAREANELSAMSERQLDAELAEELGPVREWMQDHIATVEFANELYPDQLDIDEARHALEDPGI
ncbi:hypothetical protein SD70_24105 [Gordoniibacillus kamchatkensis]|uniref:Uncharacterized protein n=1 Tax=Gordoniibacillus kamchatkensis TaxID=1590651 RepID=A0ABR5ADK8_9BACL|nr:hypothetical protein [Paenibacillus sp. VKM B-2647]KIL38778.1 hypothetical protein SD70_24105 [Paenibacillus sp. VKM B-2647]